MSIDTQKVSSSIHRGQLDIVADILNVSIDEVRKTHIMYRCNLSFKQLKRYLGFMMRKGLLHPVLEPKKTDSGLFEITTKGKEFLRAYKDLKSLMK